jgi:hypothetical protein
MGRPVEAQRELNLWDKPLSWDNPAVGDWLMQSMGGSRCCRNLVRLYWEANLRSVDNQTVENIMWGGINSESTLDVNVTYVRRRLPEEVRLYTLRGVYRHIMLPSIQREWYLLPEDEERIITDFQPLVQPLARWAFTRHVDGNFLCARTQPQSLQVMDLFMKQVNSAVPLQNALSYLDMSPYTGEDMQTVLTRLRTTICSLNKFLGQYPDGHVSINTLRKYGYILRMTD